MRRPRDGRTGGRKGGAATTASSRRGRTPRSAAFLPSSGNLLPPPPDAASRGADNDSQGRYPSSPQIAVDLHAVERVEESKWPERDLRIHP
uniref:Uncharacterized protein n=1 Tax=Oryza glumipatula TaxID=40148 RepID=A0A0E0B458_9ORYZ